MHMWQQLVILREPVAGTSSAKHMGKVPELRNQDTKSTFSSIYILYFYSMAIFL